MIENDFTELQKLIKQCNEAYYEQMPPRDEITEDEEIKLNFERFLNVISYLETLEKYMILEQELGVPLEVLFEAMEGCFYKVGDEITDGKMDYFYKSIGGEWMAKFIPNGWILGTLDRSQLRYYLKDYGKNWSLDDKDLEV